MFTYKHWDVALCHPLSLPFACVVSKYVTPHLLLVLSGLSLPDFSGKTLPRTRTRAHTHTYTHTHTQTEHELDHVSLSLDCYCSTNTSTTVKKNVPENKP